MSWRVTEILLALLLVAGTDCAKATQDRDAVLCNPFMGWVLYPCENGDIPDAAKYWASQDGNARVASTCYIRVLWSEMEPREGVYAWDSDPNFKALIRGALERHLRLALRVYVTSRDVPRQATPEWVFTDGVRVATIDNGGKSPDVRDPIFQRKYGAFIQALGREFDNPARVNWVDASNLGWWGEMHHLDYLSDKAGRDGVLRWLAGTYFRAFTHVPIAISFPNPTWTDAEMDTYCFSMGNFVIRRDGVAGGYGDVNERQEQAIRARWPVMPFIAEGYHPEATAAEKHATLEQALEMHANFLDLRQPASADDWTKHHSDWVKEFNLKGGYRFVIDSINYPRNNPNDRGVCIEARVRNVGVGVFPNNLKCWHWRYKLAFALMSHSSDKPESVLVDSDLKDDPWNWRFGQPCDATVCRQFVPVTPGSYDLCVAVVDTADGNKPAIQLAITAPRTSTGWYRWGRITILPK